MTLAFPLKTPLLGGLAATVPFIVMEIVNGSVTFSNFPLPLFITLWLLITLFIALVSQRSLKATATGGVWRMAGRIILALVVLSIWIQIVIDRMPCFLGVPNCD